jgi:indole-3-glycerol phosphate synthase
MTILETIVAHKRAEVEVRKRMRPLSSLLLDLPYADEVRDFRGALVAGRLPGPRVIAEIKRRSPSKGELRPGLDPARLAAVYEANGASAISVLVDERFFGGSLADLSAARTSVKLPVLCKEFIVDPYQVYEARMSGADAVLLIAGILDRRQLREYRELASGLGMPSLVEVHDEVELMTAVYSGAEIVGVNNRDLRTFEVSLDVTRSLIPWVPEYMVTVSESGIRDGADRELMAAMGVDALLVGESLITAPDVEAATREICGVMLREEVSVK